MKDWKNRTLGELVKSGQGIIQTGPFGSQLHAADYVEEGVPCLMPINLKNNKIDISKVSFISSVDAHRLSKHLVQIGDIIYSRRGDITQKAHITKNEEGYFCGTGCLLVRVGKNIDSKFLVYFLSTSTSNSWIKNHAVGITMPNLNTKILSRFPVSFPDYAIQKQIAKVLSDLDSKIELNNKINTELEGMAKLIYAYWFVQFDFPFDFAQGKPADDTSKPLDIKPYKSGGGKMVWDKELKREIPEGWESGEFGDLGTIIGGSTPSKAINENFTNNGVPWITPKDLSINSGKKFISHGELDVTDLGIKYGGLKILPTNCVLMSSRAPIGYLAISRIPVTTNQGFKSFIPNKDYPSSFIFYTVKQNMNLIENNASGSTFREISGNVLKSIKICSPDKSLIKSFDKKLHPILVKQDKVELENQQLSSLRDWLLPMLMNGQVRVMEGESELNIAADVPRAGYGKGGF